MSELHIGQMCVFYDQGDMTSPPVVAIVTSVGQNGTVDLATFPPNWTVVAPRRQVRWVGSPLLQENKTIAKTYGAWDFLETLLDSQRKEEETKAEISKRRASEAFEQQKKQAAMDDQYAEEIVTMRRDRNMTPYDIAEELTVKTGHTWSYQRVGRILKKNNLLPAT